MVDSEKGKTQLLEELAHLRRRVAELERGQGPAGVTPAPEHPPAAEPTQPALTESDFRNLMETSQFLFWRLDLEGRYTFVNPAWETLLGFAREELLGHHFTEFRTPEGSRQVLDYRKKILSGTQPVGRFETTLLSKNGGEKAVIFEARPFLNERGEVAGTQGTAWDITARKEIEQKLRDHQRLLESVFINAPILLWVKDLQGKYVMVTEEFTKAYGGEATDFIGRDLGEMGIVAKATQQSWAQEDRRVFEQGEKTENPAQRFFLRSGEQRWQSLRKVPLRGEDGRVSHLVGAAINITDRVRAETELQASEQRLRSIVDHIPAPVILRDLESRYLLVNRAFEEWSALSKAEVLGKTPNEVFPGGVGAQVVAMDREVISTGQVREIEEEISHVDGAGRTTITTNFPVRDTEGRISGVGTITTDISDRKSLEDQLRQTQKLQALGTLAGGIAHDFNNVLYPIQGFTDLVMKSLAPDSPEHDHLTQVAKSAARAKALVSQILLFSRQTKTTKTPQNLAPIAQEVAKFSRSVLPVTITVREDFSPAAPQVVGDPSQLHQVLMNLCVNAGHALPEGGELAIALTRVEMDGLRCFDGTILHGPHLRLAVSDTGVGIEPKTMGKIFDPFFTTREVGEGTGLGLSTVFGIVKEHGGGIVVASDPGRGTVFEVFLPAYQGETQAPAAAGEEAPVGNERILFVDDEAAITRLGKIALERYGFKVTPANDSRAALELFTAAPGSFDLIVTDQTMPGITGEQLAAEIRKTSPDIPIILCTGRPGVVSQPPGGETPVSALASKPIEPRALGQLIRTLLDQPGPAAPKPGGTPPSTGLGRGHA